MASEPIVMAGGTTVVGGGDMMDVLEPELRAVLPLEVWRARTVADDPEPRVIVEPGERVEPDMIYWD